MMIASKAVSISITRLSPNPSPLMMSACVLSMASCIVVPADISPTRFQYGGKLNDGWINVVNPFRATIVLGTPGSGKSYAVVNNYIKQMISKGFSVYIYDYKFDDLSTIAYNTLLHNMDKYKVKPHFYVINFDDPHRSHRCNPINPEFMTDISDAYEASYTIMLNLNKTWV